MNQRLWISTLAAWTLTTLIGLPRAVAAEVTAIAFGDLYDFSDGGKPFAACKTGKEAYFQDISGDTWYSAWGADDTAWINHDDGLGFNNAGGLFARHRLCRLIGDPNLATDTFLGENLNPGTMGKTLPHFQFGGDRAYTSSIAEIDGVLYLFLHDWTPKVLWPPINGLIIKSSDGGKTWVNHLGGTGTIPEVKDAMFPKAPWSFLKFIQYGKGGATPQRDNLDKYVYLATGNNFLARVPRAKLPALNKADFEFYRGGELDGLLDASWSRDPEGSGPGGKSGGFGLGNISYNEALQTYVFAGHSSYLPPGQNVDLNTVAKSRLVISVAPHPWGPWRPLVRQAYCGSLSWPSLLCNKFTMSDGLKMWHALCGGWKGDLVNYGLQYTPMYFSTGRMEQLEAEQGVLHGTSAAHSYPSFSGTGYVGGFARPGDGVNFQTGNVHGEGWHIVRLHYTSPAINRATLSVYVNGKKVRRVRLSLNNCDGPPEESWTDCSAIYYLRDGLNRIELRRDDGDQAEGVLVDYIAVSAEPTYNEGLNLAWMATATSSSGQADDAIKGYVDGRREWIAAGGAGEWLQLTWITPQTLQKAVLYDRSDRNVQVLSGTLTFSDGSSVKVGKLQNDGEAGTVVSFPERRVSWVKFTVDAVKPGTTQAGLGEIEVR